MKIEIDTQNKTVLVKEFTNIEALIKELKLMNINLKEYSLKTETIYQNYPYYYQYPTIVPCDLGVMKYNDFTTICELKIN